MKLKDVTGWFAAGSRMLRAMSMLSDGAFRLFVYICLRADRDTGRLPVAQAELARALGKSRNSIRAYLEELTGEGVCVCRQAANQHQPGQIEVADDFWPYFKQPTSSAEHCDLDSAHLESTFVDQIRTRLLRYPIIRSSFGPADRKLAADLFRQGVTLEHLDRALLLGLARKYISSLNSPAAAPIFSLNYFLPLLDEVAHTAASDQYWEYLRHRVENFNAAWLARQPTGAASFEHSRKRDLPLSGDQPSPPGDYPSGGGDHPPGLGHHSHGADDHPPGLGHHPSGGHR